jgi:hypothetical protein
LLSYGFDLVDSSRRAASYVDRILRGEKPGDLPVQFPTKFEMVVNRKTAKALGLEVPLSILVRADESSNKWPAPTRSRHGHWGRRPKSCKGRNRALSGGAAPHAKLWGFAHRERRREGGNCRRDVTVGLEIGHEV